MEQFEIGDLDIPPNRKEGICKVCKEHRRLVFMNFCLKCYRKEMKALLSEKMQITKDKNNAKSKDI